MRKKIRGDRRMGASGCVPCQQEISVSTTARQCRHEPRQRCLWVRACVRVHHMLYTKSDLFRAALALGTGTSGGEWCWQREERCCRRLQHESATSASLWDQSGPLTVHSRGNPNSLKCCYERKCVVQDSVPYAMHVNAHCPAVTRNKLLASPPTPYRGSSGSASPYVHSRRIVGDL